MDEFMLKKIKIIDDFVKFRLSILKNSYLLRKNLNKLSWMSQKTKEEFFYYQYQCETKAWRVIQKYLFVDIYMDPETSIGEIEAYFNSPNYIVKKKEIDVGIELIKLEAEEKPSLKFFGSFKKDINPKIKSIYHEILNQAVNYCKTQ